jgi:hypothetical protein
VLLTPAESAGTRQIGSLLHQKENAPTVDLLLKVALGCSLVDDVDENCRAVIATCESGRGQVIRVGVTDVGLL